MRRAIRPSTSATAISSTPTTTSWATGIQGRSAACVPAKLGRGQRYRDHVNAACLRLIRQIPDNKSDRADRHHPRAQPRAAAPGADRHRHQACAVVQSFDAGLSHAPEPADPDHGAAEMVRAPGRLVQIGADPTDPASATPFCFDSETPRHDTYVRPFRLAGRPVTCGEYLEFMKAGGYDRPQFWLSDGWNEVEAQGWRAPLYWHRQHGEWMIYTLAGKAGDKRNPSAMSAFTRPRPTPPGPASACPRKPSGSCSAAPRWPTATCRNAARFTP